MYQNEFIPAVFKLQFKSDAPMTPEEWEEMIGSLMGVYANRISEREKTFIGHIKGLAELSDAAFIKFSWPAFITSIRAAAKRRAR